MAINKSQQKTLIGVLLFMSIGFTITYFIKKNIRENAEYTIGFINDHMNGPSSGPALFYYFYVDGKKYENSDFLNTEYDAKINEFYMVKYSSENPEFAELQQHWQITDTVAIKAAGFTLPKKKRNQFQSY